MHEEHTKNKDTTTGRLSQSLKPCVAKGHYARPAVNRLLESVIGVFYMIKCVLLHQRVVKVLQSVMCRLVKCATVHYNHLHLLV